MRARWMWNIRQLLLSVWFEGVALPPSLSHITTESQWRSLILTAGGDYWHVYMSKKTDGGKNTGFVNGMVASHLLCHSGTINRHSFNGALLS